MNKCFKYNGNMAGLKKLSGYILKNGLERRIKSEAVKVLEGTRTIQEMTVLLDNRDSNRENC